MQYERFGETIVLRLDPGEEILSSVQDLCRKEAVALAQESARLGEQKEELLRAQAAGKQAAATRKQLEEQRQSLAALGQQRETLSQRMEKGNAFCKACEEAAARLGVATGTVKSRVNRAREKISKICSSGAEPFDASRVQHSEGRAIK